MSVPGVSMEDHEPKPAADPAIVATEQDDEQDDALVPTVQVGSQQMVHVSELIKHRKDAKAARRELAELKPRVDRAEAVGRQLEEAAPFIEQLRSMTPEARQALATGKLPSPIGTQQPEQDREAIEWAEMNGFIDQEAKLDVQRARKNLDWLDRRHAAQQEAIIAPVRQTAAAQAVQNIRSQAYLIADPAGVPFATRESIDEAYGQLASVPELAAKREVAAVVLGVAMMIDKVKGRTPKAPTYQAPYGDPVFMEGGGPRRGVPQLSADELARAQKVGLTEKDLQTAGSALAAGGRGIRME